MHLRYFSNLPLQDHFEKHEENAKVVFIVPTTALVEQQQKQFNTYLTQESVGLSGDSQAGMVIEEIYDK